MRIAPDMAGSIRGRLARAAAAVLIVTAIGGVAGLVSSSLLGPRPSVVADASTSTTTRVSTSTAKTTTTAIFVCPAILPRGVTLTVPSTLIVTTANANTVYTVPVGTVFVVRLDHGDGCNGPEWLPPLAPPSGVIRAAVDGPVTFGTTASGTFVVVGPGDATIRFPGTCGSLMNCPLHFGWSIDIHAQPASTPTTAPRLPRTT